MRLNEQQPDATMRAMGVPLVLAREWKFWQSLPNGRHNSEQSV